jgi:hypothetical protein
MIIKASLPVFSESSEAVLLVVQVRAVLSCVVGELSM